MMSPNKVACPNCGGKFKIDKLSVHLKYFCGENAQRTEAQARQRRTADRNRQGGQRPSGQSGGGKDKSKKPKKSMTKSKTPPATKVPPKKKVRVSGDDIFDSDSGLSAVGDAVSKGRKRPSRSGTMQTKQKITKCMKSGGRDTDSSGSKYGTEDDDDLSSDESDSSEDTKLVELKKKSSKAVRSAKGGARNAADIAREKQRQALESAASKKGKKVSPKNKATDKKKKKPDADSSSDDESQGGKGGFDPIDDIDMDVLIEEAMSGARFSILHSFCWHRIVLDEAHLCVLPQIYLCYTSIKRQRAHSFFTFRNHPTASKVDHLKQQPPHSRSRVFTVGTLSSAYVHRRNRPFWCSSELNDSVMLLQQVPFGDPFAKSRGRILQLDPVSTTGSNGVLFLPSKGMQLQEYPLSIPRRTMSRLRASTFQSFCSLQQACLKRNSKRWIYRRWTAGHVQT